MTVRHQITAFFAIGALLLGAGCGGGDNQAFSAETEDPLYQQSQQAKKQGRSSEALTGLLRVIERRGEQPSPESHLDVALIYLDQIKDPVEAIHHFKKYLDLAPNSTQAALVRQKIDGARRELFRSMPGGPRDDQAARFSGQIEIERLQRVNAELQAENDRLRGNAPSPYNRTTRGPAEAVEPRPTVVSETPIKLMPTPVNTAPQMVMPQTSRAQMFTPRPTTPAPPPPSTSPTTRPASAPTRPVTSGTVAGKRHKVAPKETLFRIAQKYNVTVEAIVTVNRDVLPKGVNSTLSPGMELKIP